MNKIGKIYDISKLRNRSTPLYVVITGKDIISGTYILKDLESERSFNKPSSRKVQMNHFEIDFSAIDNGEIPEKTIDEVVDEIKSRAILAEKAQKIYSDAAERSKNITTAAPPYLPREHYHLEFLSLRNRLLECQRQFNYHNSWMTYVVNSAKYKTNDKVYIEAVHGLKKATKALKRAKKRVFFFVHNKEDARLLLAYIDKHGNDLYSVHNRIPDYGPKVELIQKNYNFVMQKLSNIEK